MKEQNSPIRFDSLSFFKIVGIIFGSLLLLFLIATAICVKSVPKHKFGFTFNRFTGELDSLSRTGLFVINPIKYGFSKVDLRPYQVRITVDLNIGERILNAKLVRFDKKGFKTFVAWHGRSAANNVENLKEILKCYAFASDGGKSCPFLKVESEIAPIQAMQIPK